MNPYQRPSPRTASPASNMQTNPTRTNNQRHSSSDRSPYFDAPPYSDRGTDDGEDDMRGEQTAETDYRQYQKINQVIQVRTAVRVQCGGYMLISPELLHQSRPQHRLVTHHPPTELQQEWRAPSEQMGWCLPSPFHAPD
jgi:hypothetical protein